MHLRMARSLASFVIVEGRNALARHGARQIGLMREAGPFKEIDRIVPLDQRARDAPRSLINLSMRPRRVSPRVERSARKAVMRIFALQTA
jgi:hypothetical protein